jgi:GTP pyrophosphokinase
MLDRELRRLGMEDLSFEKINQHTHFSNVDDLLAAIGASDFKISKALYPFRSNNSLDGVLVKRRRQPGERKKESFTVHGVGNLLTHIAKCCNPLPGEPIIGYITSGRGVTIHNRDCENMVNIESMQANRLIDVDWGQQADSGYILNVEALAYHRSGLLHDVTETLKSGKVDVLKVNTETDSEHVTRLTLQLDIPSDIRADTILGRLSSIHNMLGVKRLA